MELPAELLSTGVQRGTVLLSDSFEDIDHAKFFAVMGVYRDFIAGFFFINSRIHPVIQSKPAHFAMQYPLRKIDYPFLRYDSFLGASFKAKDEVFRLRTHTTHDRNINAQYHRLKHLCCGFFIFQKCA